MARVISAGAAHDSLFVLLQTKVVLSFKKVSQSACSCVRIQSTSDCIDVLLVRLVCDDNIVVVQRKNKVSLSGIIHEVSVNACDVAVGCDSVKRSLPAGHRAAEASRMMLRQKRKVFELQVDLDLQ